MRFSVAVCLLAVLAAPLHAGEAQNYQSLENLEIEEQSVSVCKGTELKLEAEKGLKDYTWFRQTDHLALRRGQDNRLNPLQGAVKLQGQESDTLKLTKDDVEAGLYYVLAKRGTEEKITVFNVKVTKLPEILILPEPPFEDDLDKAQSVLKVPYEEEVSLKVALKDPDKFKDTTFKSYEWTRNGNKLKAATETIVVYPIFRADYKVVAEEDGGGGCKPEATLSVEVRRLRVNFMMGEEFSTFNSEDPVNTDDDSGDGSDGEDGRDDDTDDDEPNRAFANDRFFIGLTAESYLDIDKSRNIVPFTEIRFGAANIQNDDAAAVLRDTPVVDFLSGLRWELLELPLKNGFNEQFDKEERCAGKKEEKRECCSEGDNKCKRERYVHYGRHATVYLKGAYGLLIPDSDKADEDLLDQSFFGAGFAYTRVGHRFFRNYLEVGMGRSDNFLNNTNRFKVNGAAFIDVVSGWQLLLAGTADVDRHGGPDDLRVLIGFQRDIRYVTDLIKNVLLGDDEEEGDDDE